LECGAWKKRTKIERAWAGPGAKQILFPNHEAHISIDLLAILLQPVTCGTIGVQHEAAEAAGIFNNQPPGVGAGISARCHDAEGTAGKHGSKFIAFPENKPFCCV
jgi:hypothetical protein